MDSSYQREETHYGDMTKAVHERIEDLNRRAHGMAPAVVESALDSGCTDRRPTGPRQAKAWDMIAEAYSWNAISDHAETLNIAEQLERDGTAYHLEYGSEGFQVVLDAEPGPEATEQVKTSEIRPGEVVLVYGMRVRVDSAKRYEDRDR